MKKGKGVKLSNIQLGFILFGFLYGSTSILNPAGGAGREAWLAVIFGLILGLMLIFMYAKISQLNPDMTLIEILKNNFGSVLGSIISVLYIWYFIHLTSLVTRNFGEFMVTTSYPETPDIVIMILFLALVVYTLKSGLEVLGRISEVVIWIVPSIIIVSCAAIFTLRDFSVFRPFLEKGLEPVIKYGFAMSTFPFGETIAFMMVFPYLNNKKKLYKTVGISTSVIGFMFLITASRDLIVLGPNLMKTVNYAPDITTKLIPGMSIEPFVDINLLIGGGIKTAICLYAATKGTAQLLGFDGHKPLVSAFALFSLVLSVWIYTNPLEMLTWANEIWPYYSIPFQYIIPLVLLVISLIKRKKQGKGET